jgi:hypothetical protein
MKYADRHTTRSNQPLHDQIENIKRIYSANKPEETGFYKYYVIIHSMDAGILKNPEYQAYLSELAEVKSISFIISVDNIKAGMLWSEQMLDRFGFVGVELNTYEDYYYDLEYQAPLFSLKNDN